LFNTDFKEGLFCEIVGKDVTLHSQIQGVERDIFIGPIAAGRQGTPDSYREVRALDSESRGLL